MILIYTNLSWDHDKIRKSLEIDVICLSHKQCVYAKCAYNIWMFDVLRIYLDFFGRSTERSIHLKMKWKLPKWLAFRKRIDHTDLYMPGPAKSSESNMKGKQQREVDEVHSL